MKTKMGATLTRTERKMPEGKTKLAATLTRTERKVADTKGKKK